MATAYTSGVADGKVTDFGTFVRQCAHAFLVHLRDESVDGPLRKVALGLYHRQQLSRAKRRLARTKRMTLAEAARVMARQLREAKQTAARYDAKDAAERGRYKAMLAKVEVWKPPTTKHETLKTFMTGQLKGSIEFDCPDGRKNGENFRLDVRGDTPESFRRGLVEKAERDVAYFEKELAKERKRIEETNTWIDQLEGSLQ